MGSAILPPASGAFTKIFLALFASEQKTLGKRAFRTKLGSYYASFQPVFTFEFQRRNQMPKKTGLPKTPPSESEHAIKFLTEISEALKQGHRHFDDAVVTHCIRLINDYVDGGALGESSESAQLPSYTASRH